MKLIRRTLPLEMVFLAVIAPAIALSTAGFGYLTYTRLYSTILAGFDRKLAALSSTTSVYLDPDEMIDLLARKKAIKDAGKDPELDPTYLKFVLPMRQIRERAGLTFVYTQMLEPGEGRKCIYMVDGTVGEGHSELGSEDTIPEEDWDVALRVQHDGVAAQTGIRRWAQWGLLKCGWAPMYGKDGTIKAMAGTDVEITIIRQKTYAALLETVGVGALTLALAGLISVRVARKLTAPLGQVREASLRIASGNYGFRCVVENPREMSTLGHSLNRLGQIMQTTLDEARPRLLAWRRHRGVQALLEVLALRPYRSPELAIAGDPGTSASGFAVEGPLALVWIGEQQADEMSARKVARDLEHLGRSLLKKHGVAAGEQLRALVPRLVPGCAVVDLRDWSVYLHGSGLEARVAGAGGAVSQSGTVHVAAGQTVNLTFAGLQAIAAAIVRPPRAGALAGPTESPA